MNSEKYTSKAALEAGKSGRIEEWVHLFLCGEGDNAPFSDGLKLEKKVLCRTALYAAWYV